MVDNTGRFDGRAGGYERFRPSYPAEAVDVIIAECGLEPGSQVADIGSGTGIFSALLLQRGIHVFAVEPNADMAETARRSLARAPGFRGVNGTAEATGLEDGCVDAVTAAQAFHWFDPAAAKVEMRRILRPGGTVALVWNQRDTRTDLQREYAALLSRHVPDYEEQVHTRFSDTDIETFLDGGPARMFSFRNLQLLDFDGLAGRMSSSSYTPPAGSAAHDRLLRDLAVLFERFEEGGTVAFEYETRLFLGKLSPGGGR